MPFARLEGAEERHAELLSQLLRSHGHTPSAPASELPPDAATLGDACAISLEAERANVALYDELLAAGPPDDVRCVYQHLRGLSAERHIPALERCAGAR